MVEWKTVCRVCGEDVDNKTALTHFLTKHMEAAHYMLAVPVLGSIELPVRKKKKLQKAPVVEDEDEDEGELTFE
ncbi:MAG: hypothetical protein JJE48_06715 [Actinobacteria bacterium]|nr:hypothetical protein [Actinomycetota bacterium]